VDDRCGPVLMVIRCVERHVLNYSGLGEAARIRNEEQAQLTNRVDATSRQLKDLQKQVNTLSTPPTQGKVAAQLATVRVKINQVDRDLLALRNAIEDDPAKALQIPLLKRDIDNIKVTNQASLLAMQQNLDRQHDLMKWVFGTFISGLIGLVVTGFASSKKRVPANSEA
jgi:chromosome segregation ATPase